ncbi:S-adenosyl-l-methionine hydroxide adenosyltransferase family protein [Candidatus Bathyarchaeota archaeon]|nr:S-adenosyl-l-methionine hydroxide adenosyltransferase family protein [Candidatus Bathyarchaeota archaeon]
MPAQIFTLTTDFGLKDPYVAEMKAVILSVCPNAVVVDVTHEVEKFSIRMGAYMLASAAPYFPQGSVHVAVVDPDVGTQRRPIIVQTTHSFFVGPDNGLLFLAAEAQGIKRIYEIASRRFMLPHVSSTFHGRDIFAPAAAHLANGVPAEEFGPEITEVAKPKFTKVTRVKDSLVGEVLHVDGFGNIITNVRAKDIASLKEGVVQAELPFGKLQLKLSKTYAEAKLQEPIALIGSHDFLEIALNQGNAAAKFNIKTGDKITLTVT